MREKSEGKRPQNTLEMLGTHGRVPDPHYLQVLCCVGADFAISRSDTTLISTMSNEPMFCSTARLRLQVRCCRGVRPGDQGPTVEVAIEMPQAALVPIWMGYPVLVSMRTLVPCLARGPHAHPLRHSIPGRMHRDAGQINSKKHPLARLITRQGVVSSPENSRGGVQPSQSPQHLAKPDRRDQSRVPKESSGQQQSRSTRCGY